MAAAAPRADGLLVDVLRSSGNWSTTFDEAPTRRTAYRNTILHNR
jgi:hypothetical protein